MGRQWNIKSDFSRFTNRVRYGLRQLRFTLDANGRAINVTRVQGTKRDLARKSAKEPIAKYGRACDGSEKLIRLQKLTKLPSENNLIDALSQTAP